MYYLGLDIGGTKIAAVVMDAQGRERRVTAARRKKRAIRSLWNRWSPLSTRFAMTYNSR
jgi:predicted NBD/HSP70 family sugar kinase